MRKKSIKAISFFFHPDYFIMQKSKVWSHNLGLDKSAIEII
jgi:hypothetical protein